MAPATVSHVLAESFIVDGFRRHHTECADGVQSAHFGAVERILATVEFDRLTRVAARQRQAVDWENVIALPIAGRTLTRSVA